jgi:hypothetical protein
VRGIIWDSIRAYFGKQRRISGRILITSNRAVLRAFLGGGWERIPGAFAIKTRVLSEPEIDNQPGFFKCYTMIEVYFLMS